MMTESEIAQQIRVMWNDRTYSTQEICKEAGFTYAGLHRRLGKRDLIENDDAIIKENWFNPLLTEEEAAASAGITVKAMYQRYGKRKITKTTYRKSKSIPE